LASADSSSTRARLYAPTPLAESWGLVTNKQGSHNERLQRRFAFVEQILRLCCGLLDAERFARGIQAPGERKQLLRQLDAPTLGHRANAARALAGVVRQHAPTSVLAPLAIALSDATSPLYRGLARLVDARNRWAHDGLKSASEEDCAVVLEETHAETHSLAGIVELLLDAPIVVIEERWKHPGSVPIAKVISFVGREQQVIEQPNPPELAEGHPFMLTREGLAVPLTPWVMFGRFAQAMDHLRLLDRVSREEGVATFVRGDDPHGQRHRHINVNLREPEELDKLMERLVGPDPKIAALWQALVGPRVAAGPSRLHLPGYTVGRLLGRGASGAVWEATRDDDGRTVALKVLRPELVESPERRARLAREYALLAPLSHPGVARVYSLRDDTPHGPVLEMERVEGRPLSALVGDGPLRPLDAAKLCVKLLDALIVVHGAKVVHRDLKPENILVQADGSPRVVDFGIARHTEGERLTGTLDKLGSQGFAAPEQHRGDEIDARADLYAVGKLLVWMCRRPEDAEGLGGLPGALQRVARRATQPAPSDRYLDAASFRAELQGILQDGWDGPPVGLGDLLPGGLRLVRQLSSPRAGVYLFRAAPLEGGAEVAVLISGTDPKERQAFRETFRGASAAELKQMRSNGARVSEDGLVFAEIDGDGAEEHVARLFGSVQPASAWDDLPTAETVLAGVGAAAAVGAAALGALFIKQKLDERQKAAPAAPPPATSPPPTPPPAAPAPAARPAPKPPPLASPAAAQRAAAVGLGAFMKKVLGETAPAAAPPAAPAAEKAPPSAPAVLAQAQLIGLLLVALTRATREHHVTNEGWARLCKTPLASLAVLLGPEGAALSGPVGDGLSLVGSRGQALLLLSKLNQPGVDVESIRAAVQTVRTLRGVFQTASAAVNPAGLAPVARRGPEAWEVLFVQGQTTTWVKALPLKG
jgi:hypothetical protein